MSAKQTYHFGKGRVELAKILPNGTLDKWLWLVDVNELSTSFEESKWSHKESHSGQNFEVREISEGATASGQLTLLTLNLDNLAIIARGTVSQKAAGTVTGESLGTVTANSILQLANGGVSDLVITDSATPTPAPIAPTHYTYDEWGEIVFNSLPTATAPTMPLKAAYEHLEANQLAFLNADPAEYALRYKGINLAEGNKKCLVEFYKISVGLLQSLSLIQSGQQMASTPVSFKPLADMSKPKAGDFGQFGRIVTYGY